MKDDMLEALDAIETGMCRIKESRDIWQNDLVYALCQGVRLLLLKEIKRNSTQQGNQKEVSELECTL